MERKITKLDFNSNDGEHKILTLQLAQSTTNLKYFSHEPPQFQETLYVTRVYSNLKSFEEIYFNKKLGVCLRKHFQRGVISPAKY